MESYGVHTQAYGCRMCRTSLRDSVFGIAD
jgi:hypothetical protein